MERGEEERQDRLGDPSTRRQRADERGEAVAAAKLVDERREGCGVRDELVHGDWRGTRPARPSYSRPAAPAAEVNRPEPWRRCRRLPACGQASTCALPCSCLVLET